jgi:hypothetical protein
MWRRGKGFEPSDGVTHRDQQADRCLKPTATSPKDGLSTPLLFFRVIVAPSIIWLGFIDTNIVLREI